MKQSSSRLPLFAGIVSLALGAMAIACTAAPTGEVPGGNEDDKQESNATSATPTKNNTSTSSSGSAPSNPTPTNPTASDASTPVPGTDAGTTPTPTPTDPGACAASADFNACIDCCDQANPGGFDVSDQAWGDCVCQTPGVCAQACGNDFCNGAPPSAACEQCLDNNTQQCEQAADAACAANAPCAAAMSCFTGSQCDQKP